MEFVLLNVTTACQMFKVGQKVSTPDGCGVIKVIEKNRVEDRYGVEIYELYDKKVILYFFKSEIQSDKTIKRKRI